MINWFFINTHSIYKILYNIYKTISDREMILWMKQYLKEGMTTVDLGANIGYYSNFLSKQVGKTGKVHAFEPDKTNFDLLMKNTSNLKNIILNKLAVGNTNGPIKLYLSRNLNVDHKSFKTKESRKFKTIKCVSLDKYFGKRKKVDLIKIDIQGFDYHAIKGAKNLIKQQKHIAIIGEFWPWGLREANVNPQEYLDLLKSLKLKVILNLCKPLKELENNKRYHADFIAFK